MFRRPLQPQRLRKQPRARRIQAATAVQMPRVVNVPKTAQKRRSRNNRRFKLPTVAIKQVLFSARWISLGLLVITIYALILTGLDEHFYLTAIPVEGTAVIPAGEIVGVSGLAGAHIFAADPNEAATRIAELPGVISATVSLGWPNQVMIHIKEDSPIAIWQEGQTRYWIMKDGHLLPARADTLGLLVIEAEVPLVMQEEKAVESTENAEQVVEDVPQAGWVFVPQEVLAGALQLKELRPNIEKLYYRPSGGLSYQDGRGWRAYFGSSTDMPQKLVVYETLVNSLLEQQLTPTYISVSNQEKPYYLATGGTEE